MMPRYRRLAAVALTLAIASSSGIAVAQQLYVYPQKGQSPAQQSKDQGECHAWAVQQTGFDPGMATAAAPPAAAPQGGAVRGGARGAAVGAVGGAIAGDAGKGAAIGAATGALVGGMRRRDQARQQEAQQQQVQAQTANRSAEYRRAMGACLTGRGYTVN